MSHVKRIALDGKHDARQLRNALGRFPTGVTVVTARGATGRLEALTVNSFTALSLEPALVLWCLNHSSPSVAGFRAGQFFAVNVLRATQDTLSTAARANVSFYTIDPRALVGAPAPTSCR